MRLLILGGEVCPYDLVERWSRPHLTIINTYGPTETTVVATYALCEKGKTPTIGRPLADCELMILDENQQPLSAGEVGELYIGGTCVALGYRNKPELTQKKFIFHPEHQGRRLYRTGDLVCLTPEGELQFEGRADDQIKLRGFRVELAEIESVLMEQPEIRAAVVALQELESGMQTLVAYLILNDGAQINQEKILTALHAKLPNYMVPGILEQLKEFPLLQSGKIDRKQLPKPSVHQVALQNNSVLAQTATEKKIALVWEELFKCSPISIKADFFHELGGHSLAAAKMISLLRKERGLQHISMLDVYENPTIEQLARRVDETVEQEALHALQNISAQIGEPLRESQLRYYFCGVLQIFGCYLRFALSSWQFLFVFLILIAAMGKASILSSQFLWPLGLIVVGIQPALFMIAILAKWLFLGRIKPGNYRLWGFYYCRWWLVQQLQNLTTIEYMVGSPFINFYLRLMGAKIGKDCYIGTSMINAFDLLHIDEGSSVGADTNLSGYIVENGWLKIGSINIGKRCFVGASSVLEINTRMGDDARLGDLSMLSVGRMIPEKQHFTGSPAAPGAVEIPENLLIAADHRTPASRLNKIKLIFLHSLGLTFLLLLYTIALIPGIALIDYFFLHGRWLMCVLVSPLSALIFIVLFCTLIFVAKRLLLGTVQPGIYATDSFYYVRKWTIDRMMDLSLNTVQALYATLYLPQWLRMLGAKVGKHTEISTTAHTSPDLLSIEDESFIADGVFLGAPCVFRQFMVVARIAIGKRTFIGNSALIPAGVTLGDGCLVGCLSVPPVHEEAAKSDTSWFGSPAVFLPRREIFTGFSEAETYIPSKKLYCTRLAIDFLKVILPGAFIFLMLSLQFITAGFLLRHMNVLAVIFAFPLFDFVILTGISGMIIVLKWLLLGRFHPGIRPAWSVFVWLNELITGLYDAFMAPILLEGLQGTPFMGFFLRLLGAKIGKRVFLDTTFFTEYDLVEIGDDVVLNAYTTIQTHLFEDRILKMARLKIEKNCYVGSLAVVLYDTVMEQGASLASLSLLMKGETLPANSHWGGIPAQHQRRRLYVAGSLLKV
ncbi:MAG TPA: Pls/PosA family non-ribosomal peptide synthetase [Gammaproteobacteria bacterium]|nr:Pls/PosA family non-ribosomal peptide synthetase [Gammaproteobacteria bacterium]